MTDAERFVALELTQKELCKTVEEIKTNDLPHLALAIEEVRVTASSAKFRAGLTIYGLIYIGVMLTILGIMVAIR